MRTSAASQGSARLAPTLDSDGEGRLPCVGLVSAAEQVTRVRPTRNREPDRGRQVTGTSESTSSTAVTLYLTRARFRRTSRRSSGLLNPCKYRVFD
jgi:hypothetical protein